MTYRVALTYHPNVGTFRGKRGAWRVLDVWEPLSCPPQVDRVVTDMSHVSALLLPAAREYRRGTWVNPLKILKEYQSTKRSNEQ